MKIEEELIYSDYQIQAFQRSRIDKGKRIPATIGMRCPSCKKAIDNLRHGKKGICPYCRLQMWRYGNGLTCVKKD